MAAILARGAYVLGKGAYNVGSGATKYLRNSLAKRGEAIAEKRGIANAAEQQVAKHPGATAVASGATAITDRPSEQPSKLDIAKNVAKVAAQNVYNTGKGIYDSATKIEIKGPIDQSNEIARAADQTIQTLESVLSDPRSERCLVNGFANLIEKTSELMVPIMTDVIMQNALKDPNIRLIINSNIEKMMEEIIQGLTPEEIKNIVDNMDGECRTAFMSVPI